METDKLILFLKDLTNSLENKKLNEDQVMHIGEFYMSYGFKNTINNDETPKFSTISSKLSSKVTILLIAVGFLFLVSHALHVENSSCKVYPQPPW